MNQGYFVISDISGYTQYMNQSELDHASEIISSVMRSIAEHIHPPLNISNYQGDAILMYAPKEKVLNPQALVKQITDIYFAFRRQLVQMQFNTSCRCNACKNIPELDLKFFVHFGNYALQSMVDREELTGPDVIQTHRLMKNNVFEQTGVSAYVMFTEEAAEGVVIDQVFSDHEKIQVSITDQENLEVRLQRLHNLWESELQSNDRRINISSDKGWVKTQVQLTVPPEIAWDYITRPEYKKDWLGMDEVNHIPLKGKAYGAGSKYHCAHGEAGDFDYEVVDWRPFDYLTIKGIAPGNLSFIQTDSLEANEKGTLYRVYFAPQAKGVIRSFLNNRRAGKMQAQYQAMYDMCHNGLRDYIIEQESIKQR